MRSSVGRTPSNGGRPVSRLTKSTSSSRSGSDSRRSIDGTSELGFTSLAVETPISCLSLNADSSKIVVGGRNLLKIYDAEQDEFIELVNLRVGLGQGSQQHCNPADVAWSPHFENVIVSTGYNGAVVQWDLNRAGMHKQEYVFAAHPRMVNRLVLHPVNKYLLMTGSQDGLMKIYDIRTHSLDYTLNGNTNSGIRDIQFDPFNEHRYAAAYDSGVVQLWDIRFPSKWERHYLAHNGPVLSLDWHRSEAHWLATGGRDKLINVWDVKDPQRLISLYSVQTIGGVARLRWRPHHKYQICSSALLTDYGVNTWDLQRPYAPVTSFSIHRDMIAGGVARLRWRPHHKYQICSSALLTDYGVNTWDLQRPYAPVTSFSIHRDMIAGICFRNDDQEVFYTAGRDGLMVRNLYSHPTYRPQKSFNPVACDIGVHGCLLHAGHDGLVAEHSSQKSSTIGQSARRFPSYFRREEESGGKVVYLSLLSHFSDIECLSMNGFITMAKNYRLSGLSVPDLCHHNADVADSVNCHRIAESWRMLEVLLGSASLSSPDSASLLPIPVCIESLSPDPSSMLSHNLLDTEQSTSTLNEEREVGQTRSSIADRRTVSCSENLTTKPRSSSMINDNTQSLAGRAMLALNRRVDTLAVTQTDSNQSNALPPSSLALTNTSAYQQQTYETRSRKPSITTGRLASKTGDDYFNAGFNIYAQNNSQTYLANPSTSLIKEAAKSSNMSRSLTSDSINAIPSKSNPSHSTLMNVLSTSVSQPNTPGSSLPRPITGSSTNRIVITGNRSQRPDEEQTFGSGSWKQETTLSSSQLSDRKTVQQNRSATLRPSKTNDKDSSKSSSMMHKRKIGMANLDTRSATLLSQQNIKYGVPRDVERVKDQERNAPSKSNSSNNHLVKAAAGVVTRAGQFSDELAEENFRLIDATKLSTMKSSWSCGAGFLNERGNITGRTFKTSYDEESDDDDDDVIDYSNDDSEDDDDDDNAGDDDDDEAAEDDDDDESDAEELKEITGQNKTMKLYNGKSSLLQKRKKVSPINGLSKLNRSSCCFSSSFIPDDNWAEFGPASCQFFINLDRFNGITSRKSDGFDDCLKSLTVLAEAVAAVQEEESLSRKGSGASSLEPLAPNRGASISREGSPAVFDCTLVSSGARTKVVSKSNSGTSRVEFSTNDGGDGSSTCSDSGSGANTTIMNEPGELINDDMITLRQDVLQAPSYERFLKGWDHSDVLADMLEYFADQNDVQTAVTMVIVLGETIARQSVTEQQLEHWFFSYIELLRKFELWREATEIISLACVSEVNQLTLTSTQIYTFCSICSKPLLKAGWTCQRCNQYLHKCSLCHLPVKGVYVWCQGCAHGGHVNHMQDWFKTHKQCPTGCGHECEYT